MDNHSLVESFRKLVRLTTYESYAPFIARFYEKPCRASSVVDLLAPGLPDYLAESSSTSGNLPKTFPKYNRLSKIGSQKPGSRATFDPLRRRTTAYVWHLGYQHMNVEDEDNCSVTTVYLTYGTVVTQRTRLNLDPKKDGERMATFVLNHAAPYAAGFIQKWRSFLLVHALFALGSRTLRSMSMAFLNTFVNMIRHLDAEYDVMVDCIANGTIPDLEGIADVRHYLESNVFPDPERAADLRTLGRPSSRPGWCSLVWPNLRSIFTIASGSFASSIPLARWFLGPRPKIRARGYGSTEVWIGSPYNSLELNQFKPSDKNIIEFLDINGSDSINDLAQLWEVKLGKRYELVLTTQDGLWRYRIGDVVEVSGFDPTDGVPIIQFVERRNVAIRFQDFMVTETELRTALAALSPSVLKNVIDWTTTIDERQLPPTIGFFVELANEQDHDPDSDLAHATDHMLAHLARSNANISWAHAHAILRPPTLARVRRGTFADFRQLKLDEGGRAAGLGQVKVPVVLPKPAYVAWFRDRVVQEW